MKKIRTETVWRSQNATSKLASFQIASKIVVIRDVQVMLDRDLAELYEINTKVLKQAVKRNIERFPETFCFELDKKEFENLRSQLGMRTII
jgi:formaldehyde-activating enzyme involved in methanogenesis